MVKVNTIHMPHVLCRYTRKDIPGRGLKLVHRWCLFRKCNLDVLHLLRTQNVARLTGIGEGGVVRNGGREPGHGDVITVCNDREVHTDGGRLLVLGGWPNR